MLHDHGLLEWDPEVRKGTIFLRAFGCTEGIDHPNAGITTCTACSAIPLSLPYQNLLNRVIGGCHESTPLIYLTAAQLVETIRRKIRHNDSLRLSSLNAGRSLLARAREIDAYKRILTVVASGEVKRVHAVVTVARRNGAGPLGILNRLLQAFNQTYSAKSFDEAEFHKAALALRLAGGRLVEIFHNADGLPGLSTVRRHSQLVQLIPFSSYPTTTGMTTNLTRIFPQPLRHPEGSPKKVGAVLMLDEIAIDRRVRYEPHSNHFIGVCQEHGAKSVSLEFASMADADALGARLQDGRCHLASEVS